MQEVKWQKYQYTKDALLRDGFGCTGERTLVAVADTHGRFAVKYIFWPLDEAASAMSALGEYVLDTRGKVLRKARGLSDFGDRGGGKSERGQMVMFGSHNAIPEKKGGRTIPAAYRFRHDVDPVLNELLRRHVDALSALEREMIPSLAAKRDALAAEHDPRCMHRMSRDCTAFSASLAAHYVVTAHDDSGKASETIVFLNRSGPLPEGHEWSFAVGGHVHPLPNEKGKAVLLFVEGEG
eukprot:7387298-Prymnesium_polylepis.1